MCLAVIVRFTTSGGIPTTPQELQEAFIAIAPKDANVMLETTGDIVYLIVHDKNRQQIGEATYYVEDLAALKVDSREFTAQREKALPLAARSSFTSKNEAAKPTARNIHYKETPPEKALEINEKVTGKK